MLTKANIFVNGLVQGVCYRKFSQINAKNLGLTGWTKNLDDGRVELLVEGEKGLIEEFVKTLQVGPTSSDVKGVNIEWQKYSGEFNDFYITE